MYFWWELIIIVLSIYLVFVLECFGHLMLELWTMTVFARLWLVFLTNKNYNSKFWAPFNTLICPYFSVSRNIHGMPPEILSFGSQVSDFWTMTLFFLTHFFYFQPVKFLFTIFGSFYYYFYLNESKKGTKTMLKKHYLVCHKKKIIYSGLLLIIRISVFETIELNPCIC